MTTSNFDLCKAEWLELVFAKRNKEYGAYYLRQHNAANVNKAMIITFVAVTALFIVGGKLVQAKPKEVITETVVNLNTVYKAKTDRPKPKAEVHHSKPSAPKPPVTSTKYVVPVVTAAPVKEEPTRIDEIKGEIGQETITIPGDGKVTVNDGTKTAGAGGTGIENAPDNTVHDFAEVNPEPIGGAAAWAKFLQKNLRYPGEAADRGISGRVYVSFVVEKDGHLSSFEIVKGAGYGMDDESLRVLKKAPAWKPGKQNGQPVRVKYTLPLNFVLGDN